MEAGDKRGRLLRHWQRAPAGRIRFGRRIGRQLASDFGGLPLKVRVEMATYEPTILRVKELYGFVPKTCWIAHVLELNGQTPRIAHNRIDPRARKVPCPPDKRVPIERVLRELGKIS
jgi:hypothetical protein